MHVSVIARTYVRLHARTCTHSIANSTRKRTQTQTHANKCTQTIAAIDAWAVSACKRDCVLRVGSKTFRMYYSDKCCIHVSVYHVAGKFSSVKIEQFVQFLIWFICGSNV